MRASRIAIVEALSICGAFALLCGQAKAESWNFNFDFGIGDSFTTMHESAQAVVTAPYLGISGGGSVRSSFVLVGNYQVDVHQTYFSSREAGLRVITRVSEETFTARRRPGFGSEIVRSPDTILGSGPMTADAARYNVSRIGSTIGRGVIRHDFSANLLVASGSFSPDPVSVEVYIPLYQGFDSSGYFDDLEIVADRIVTPDFNRDEYFTCDDVNALAISIASGANNLTFDLTFDGIVDSDDMREWLDWAGPIRLHNSTGFRPGDANLDGNVDGSDFGIWNAHKFTNSISWCSGDFNADGVVDGSDFGIWNANKFTAADGSTVPEPACPIGVLILGGAIAHRRR